MSNQPTEAANPLSGDHTYLKPTGDTVFVEHGEYDEERQSFAGEYHADVYELPDGTRVAKLMDLSQD